MKTVLAYKKTVVSAIVVALIVIAWALGQLEIADVLERLGIIAGEGQ